MRAKRQLLHEIDEEKACLEISAITKPHAGPAQHAVILFLDFPLGALYLLWAESQTCGNIHG